MARGTEESFEQIKNELVAINKKYHDDKTIKYYVYADSTDRIFASYGWDKAEFYSELNRRLGVSTNETRREDKEKVRKERELAKEFAKAIKKAKGKKKAAKE